MKIATVVVTYNRLELLKGCIDSLKRQRKTIDTIIVVNNGSTDGTTEWLEERSDLVVIHQENLGGAGGFHNGIKFAHESGYDWIWIMDDDCVAEEDCLEIMCGSIERSGALCVAPMVLDRCGNPDLSHRGYFSYSEKSGVCLRRMESKFASDFWVDFSSFVGLMVGRLLVDKVGYPKKEFFIHNDDVEYCLRINKLTKIFVSARAQILHLEKATSDGIDKKSSHVSYRFVPIDQLWLQYYGARNLTWLKRNSLGGGRMKEFLLCLKIVQSMLRQAKNILLHEDNKLVRLGFYIRAYSDGWNGVFNNEKPRKILKSYMARRL